MKLRSSLMLALKNHLLHNSISQTEAAKLFGVTQLRISDLMRGKINLFSLDALVNMAAAAVCILKYVQSPRPHNLERQFGRKFTKGLTNGCTCSLGNGAALV